MGLASDLLYSNFLLYYILPFSPSVAYQTQEILEIYGDPFVIYLYFISSLIVFCVYFYCKYGKPCHSAEEFVGHRIFLAVSIFTLEILFWVNTLTIGLCSIWINIAITILMHMILIYLPISLFHHVPLFFYEMRFFHLKTTNKISFYGKLFMFFLYLPVFVFICYTFQIDLNDWDDERRPNNFEFVRLIFVVTTFGSIPVLYQAILAWNTKKLKFKGLHPTTGREWEGVMKKNKDGEWEVDLEPEEHVLVRVE